MELPKLSENNAVNEDIYEYLWMKDENGEFYNKFNDK